MNTFSNDAIADLLVHDYTDSASGDVPDTSSLSMVMLERHTFLDSWITLDVHDIPKSVIDEVGS